MGRMHRWQDGRGTLRIAAPATPDSGGAPDSPRTGPTPVRPPVPLLAPPPVAAPVPPTVPLSVPLSVPPPALPTVPLSVPLEIAASYRTRTRGLLGRDGLTGALLLTPATSVHTVRMRFPIDVAYLDRHLRVLAVRTMPPGRLGRPRLRARHVLEAEAGAMERWGVRRGVRVAIEVG